MTEWFTFETGKWFSLLSLMSLAALTAPWISQGRHKAFVMSMYFVSIAFGALLLLAGILALIVSQPWHVIWPLLLSGGVIGGVFATSLPSVRDSYIKAEERKIVARDM